MTGRRVLFLCAALSLFLAPGRAADRVVLVVWDGLRPDLVSQVNTPVLMQLAKDGVFFAHHHPVYPSSTEVNGTALATGDFPDHTTILANREYRPAIDPLASVPTEGAATIAKGDALTGGKYLPVPTVAETIHAWGFPTAVAGTKGVARLADRAPEARRTGPAKASALLAAGDAIPASLLPDLAAFLGPFPATPTFPNLAEDLWTTRALTEGLWKDAVPKFSVLWLSDPDFSQHHSAPAAAEGLSGLRSSDQNLGRLLAALDKKGLRDTTDVLVVSDHGFSTTNQAVDLAAYLTGHGLPATRRYAPGGAAAGEVLVVGLGGSSLLYVPNHDAVATKRAVALLQQASFTGVLLTRSGLPGTFPLDAVRLPDDGAAPDVVVSFRWTADLNRYGVPGLVAGDGPGAGNGTHTSLSRFDMHNTLVAAGPDFKRGWTDPLPSGNIDVAPTILFLLGAPNPPPMDGRILAEALRVPPPDAPPLQVTEQKPSVSASAGDGTWSQYLVVKTVNGTAYVDEGNGALAP